MVLHSVVNMRAVRDRLNHSRKIRKRFLNVRLPAAMLCRFNEKCRRMGRYKSDVVRALVSTWVYEG